MQSTASAFLLFYAIIAWLVVPIAVYLHTTNTALVAGADQAAQRRLGIPALCSLRCSES